MMDRTLIVEILCLTIATEQSIMVTVAHRNIKSDVTVLSYISGLTGLTCMTSPQGLSRHYHQMEAGTGIFLSYFIHVSNV